MDKISMVIMFLSIIPAFFSFVGTLATLQDWKDAGMRGFPWKPAVACAVLVVSGVGFFVGHNLNVNFYRSNVVRVVDTVTALQGESWASNRAYLANETDLQKADPSLGDKFIDKNLSKSEIIPSGKTISYEFGASRAYVRVLMDKGKVIDVNCKGMGGRCPTVPDLNLIASSTTR